MREHASRKEGGTRKHRLDGVLVGYRLARCCVGGIRVHSLVLNLVKGFGMSEKKFDSPPPMVAPVVRSREDLDAETQAAFRALAAEQARREAQRPAIQAEGEAALARLFKLASQSDTGQAGVLAAFLLGLYNGRRFRFDLTDLRRLDWALHDDCMAVLRMDGSPQQEVHMYIENGSWAFEKMARDWGLMGDGSVSTGEAGRS